MTGIQQLTDKVGMFAHSHIDSVRSDPELLLSTYTSNSRLISCPNRPLLEHPPGTGDEGFEYNDNKIRMKWLVCFIYLLVNYLQITGCQGNNWFVHV